MWTLFDIEFAGPDARHEGTPLLFREMENRAVRVGRVSQVNAAIGRHREPVLTRLMARHPNGGGRVRPVVTGERPAILV